MTKGEAFAQALRFAAKGGGPQAVLKMGGNEYDEIHTRIPSKTLMEWLGEATEFWILQDGTMQGPFTNALEWIRSKEPIMGFEQWQNPSSERR